METTSADGAQAPVAEVPLVDRVNSEPPILKGLSSTESLWAIGLAFALWVPLGTLAGIVATSLAIGVLVTGCGALATVWLAAGQMQALKRDRPDHFYIHLVHRWCARYGVARARFITHAGRWDLGRSLLHRAPRVKRRA